MMGDQGDLKALDLLAWRHMQLLNRESAVKTYRKAAVLGSTWALQQLGAIAYKARYKKGVNVEQKIKDRAEIELSYYQAAILRGDTNFLSTAEVYLEVREIELTDADKKTIRENGIKIFNELKAERAKIGLSEFDSMPLSVREFYTDVGNHYNALTTGSSPLFVMNNG